MSEDLNEERCYEVRICRGIFCTNGGKFFVVDEDGFGHKWLYLKDIFVLADIWNEWVRRSNTEIRDTIVELRHVDVVLKFARNVIEVYESQNIMSLELVRAFAKIKLMLDIARMLIREPEMVRRMPSEFKKLDEFLEGVRNKKEQG